MLQPLRVVWKAWFFVLFMTTLALFYPVFNYLLSDKSKHPQCFRLMCRWAAMLLFLAGIRMKIDQRHKLPDGPFIICANHGSYLDIITMYATFRKYFVFMGKAEISDWPLFHIFFTKGMNIPVMRGSTKGAQAAMIRSKEELAKGHCVAMFPEGTIPSTAPKMRAFKNGAFKLSMETELPIVPVTFINNWQRLQTGAALKALGSPGSSKVVIHPSVSPLDYEEEGVVKMKRDIFAIINKPLKQEYGD